MSLQTTKLSEFSLEIFGILIFLSLMNGLGTEICKQAFNTCLTTKFNWSLRVEAICIWNFLSFMNGLGTELFHSDLSKTLSSYTSFSWFFIAMILQTTKLSKLSVAIFGIWNFLSLMNGLGTKLFHSDLSKSFWPILDHKLLRCPRQISVFFRDIHFNYVNLKDFFSSSNIYLISAKEMILIKYIWIFI